MPCNNVVNKKVWKKNEKRWFTVFQQFEKEENVRFLSYINPHIINGSDMFNYANEREYFIKSAETG